MGETIRLTGGSPQKYSALGEMLVHAASGRVTPEAEKAFESAIASAPEMPQPNYYLGLAAEQRGEFAKAREIWEQLVAGAPADADWLGMVRQRIAGLPANAVPGGTAGEAIAALPTDERNAAIKSMVDGLASRLAQDGADLEGWLRLVRAYSVLRETELARTALSAARRNFPGDSAALGRLDGLARELGLGGSDVP